MKIVHYLSTNTSLFVYSTSLLSHIFNTHYFAILKMYSICVGLWRHYSVTYFCEENELPFKSMLFKVHSDFCLRYQQILGSSAFISFLQLLPFCEFFLYYKYLWNFKTSSFLTHSWVSFLLFCASLIHVQWFRIMNQKKIQKTTFSPHLNGIYHS